MSEVARRSRSIADFSRWGCLATISFVPHGTILAVQCRLLFRGIFVRRFPESGSPCPNGISRSPALLVGLSSRSSVGQLILASYRLVPASIEFSLNQSFAVLLTSAWLNAMLKRAQLAVPCPERRCPLRDAQQLGDISLGNPVSRWVGENRGQIASPFVKLRA